MKKEYTQPIVEVIELNREDVIVCSEIASLSFGGGLDGDTETPW